jgi:arginase
MVPVTSLGTRRARSWVVLDAPSNLGLRPPRPGAEPGVRGLAHALREHDLVARLGARDAGGLLVPPYAPDPDPVTGYRNGTAISGFTVDLAARVGGLLGTGERLLVLGGDCSIGLGPALALRRAGRYGLVYLDAHDDYSPPRDTERYRGLYAAGGRALGLATGTGPGPLSDLDGLRPYVLVEDAVHVGLSREPADRRDFATESFDGSGIATIPAGSVLEVGGRAAAEQALSRLASPDLQGFWVHVDMDVLDQSVMPAVDSPNPAGLGWDTLTEVLATLVRAPEFVGLHVGIYDPELDPDRTLAARTVRMLTAALAPDTR